MDWSGIIDRFWLYSRAEPALLALWALALGVAIVLAWWVGWALRNHLVGAALAGGAGALWQLAWQRWRKRFTRPRA